MSLDDVINKLKLLVSDDDTAQNISGINESFSENSISSHVKPCFNETLDLNNTSQLENWVSQHSALFESPIPEWSIYVLVFYCLIVIVSLFGNSIVCKIIFWNERMRSTTNIYIGNLSIADILMTLFNIPLQLTQILSRNWPLGQFLCRCMPFFQGLSVNVSSFTMTCIAIDRHQVIVHPLNPRPRMTSIIHKLVFIWIMATLASSPYPALADVEDDFTYSRVTRCRLIYPEPQIEVRQILTVITMAIQYLGPLLITGFTYCKICYIIWNRKSIGVMSEKQKNQRYMAKWKTIKMLIIVFVVFAISWFPLNMYHIYQDFRGVVGHNKHNPVIFLVCHWFAMSSVCYNPFVYCWLNDRFQAKAKAYLLWFLKFKKNPECDLNLSYNEANSRKERHNHSRKSSAVLSSTQSKTIYRPHLALLCNNEIQENKRKFVKDVGAIQSHPAFISETGNFLMKDKETEV